MKKRKHEAKHNTVTNLQGRGGMKRYLKRWVFHELMEICEQQYGWLLVKTSNAITEQKLYVTKHVMSSPSICQGKGMKMKVIVCLRQ